MLKDVGSTLRKRNPQVERATAEWLGGVPWQVFGTASFPERVSAQRAAADFRKLLNRAELRMRDRVCCVYSQESESKRHGTKVGEHFHFVIAGRKPISVEKLVCDWYEIIHRSQDGSDRHLDAEPYRPGDGGLEYVAKMFDDLSAMPREHNLEYFVPSARPKGDGTRRTARHIRRWYEREASIHRFLANAELTPPVLR